MDSLILVGEFDEKNGRPLLEGTLYIPRLRVGLKIDFLVDTGADITTLSPVDGSDMGVDYDALIESTMSVRGVGGVGETYVEKAILVFNEPGKAICWYHLSLDILQPQVHLEEIPSLLGRDILNRMHIRYSFPTNTLTFHVETADRIIPIPR